VKQTKNKELMDIQKRIRTFRQRSATINRTNSRIIPPIVGKVDKAIKDVGKENGFYMFSIFLLRKPHSYILMKQKVSM